MIITPVRAYVGCWRSSTSDGASSLRMPDIASCSRSVTLRRDCTSRRHSASRSPWMTATRSTRPTRARADLLQPPVAQLGQHRRVVLRRLRLRRRRGDRRRAQLAAMQARARAAFRSRHIERSGIQQCAHELRAVVDAQLAVRGRQVVAHRVGLEPASARATSLTVPPWATCRATPRSRVVRASTAVAARAVISTRRSTAAQVKRSPCTTSVDTRPPRIARASGSGRPGPFQPGHSVCSSGPNPSSASCSTPRRSQTAASRPGPGRPPRAGGSH